MKMSAIFGHNSAGGVGGEHNEPKAHQKIVMNSRVLHNNYVEGLCFHTVPSSFVLHCRPPPVYQDLSKHNDWNVKKTPLFNCQSGRKEIALSTNDVTNFWSLL